MHPFNSIRVAAAAGALALLATGAVAQTATNPNQQPAAVGTTPATAAEANRKAVPRSDVGTVVRTGPTAPAAARTAADSVGSGSSTSGSGSTAAGTGATGGGAGTTSTGSSGTGSMGTSTADGTGTSARAARADRN